MKRPLILLALALFGGCASTKSTSVRDPAFQGRQFRRLVVVATFTDLEKKATAESEFVTDLQGQGVESMSGMQVMPPTRSYSNEEISALLARVGADGVLLVTLTEATTVSTYVPGSTTTTGSGYVTGNTVNWNATTQQNPGYFINKPRVRFEVRLIDAATGNTAWMSTSLTRGNAFAGWQTLMGSLASDTVGKMAADGVVRKQ